MKITVGPRTVLAKTCSRCGHLKQGSDYGHVTMAGVRYTNSHCLPCKNEAGQPGVRRHQERSTKVAVRHGAYWTAQEIKKLSEMSQRGLTGAQMALALNRTVYSVYTMRNKLRRET